MLETPEGLATWAIDDPLECPLPWRARALAIHRVAYLDYEGPVSRGRGTVVRVDSGLYAATAWSDSAVVVRVLGQVLRGVLELREVRTGGESGAMPWRCWFRSFD